MTSQALNQGLVFQGQRVPIWNQQKGIFRPTVLRGVHLNTIITTPQGADAECCGWAWSIGGP